ncbi:hypothetical protein HELRODRAFT_167752 [Helobdella robusta]|uniref:CUB domain-containing protein n=1 Tax=Helobdella robusta TaxID=6412 RepID=T1EZR4_HELRO|nr:hypothetical protein HELRODRAFT_167752 [Helobdella robusta]ESO09927.1 hypothetical protein HELRODRAFT_167752 [Helobdella robusta]
MSDVLITDGYREITSLETVSGRTRQHSQFQMVGGVRKWNTPCHYEFYDLPKGLSSGKFFSPRYPQNYPARTHCHYHFFATHPRVVKVLLQNIQLEAANGRHNENMNNLKVLPLLRWKSRDGCHYEIGSILQYIKLNCMFRGGDIQVHMLADSDQAMQHIDWCEILKLPLQLS